MEKNKGGPSGDFEKLPKQIKNEIFEQCHSAEKCKRAFFDIDCVAKYRNKRRGDPLVESKKVA